MLNRRTRIIILRDDGIQTKNKPRGKLCAGLVSELEIAETGVSRDRGECLSRTPQQNAQWAKEKNADRSRRPLAI